MDRNIAIVLFFVCLVLFYLISYYGAFLSWWSSLALSVFLSFILLNVIYPPGAIANDSADAGLVLYVAIEIFSVVIFGLYIFGMALADQRLTNYCP